MTNEGVARQKPAIVAMCCDGPYQRYLIRRLADEFDLRGVIRHTTPNAKGTLSSRMARYRHPLDLLRYVQVRRFVSRCEAQAKPVIDRLFHFNGHAGSMPEDVARIDIENVNDDKAVKFVRSLDPDVVCINGTNLLRKPMLDLIPSFRLGAINLHTGLSPYSRGGNCNLFMLLEGHPELVGLTIHHIDPGVDSGDIIISARPTLEPEDNYETIDAKTFRLGIDLMIVAIRQLQEGRAARVKQWESGKVFLRKTGYVYRPSERVRVNNLLKQGLIRNYLEHQEQFDEGVRLVGEHH